MSKYLSTLMVLAVIIASCTKEITLEIPAADPKLVVEGRIEQGMPPFVILTKSVGYFEPTDISSFESSFVHEATVTVTVDNVVHTLDEICSQDIPQSLLPVIAEAIGISLDKLIAINYCAYTNLTMSGEVGKIYHLSIESESKTYTGSTKIPDLVPLDTAWYKAEGYDTLGFVFAHMTDPDTLGNAYRWFAKRINLGANGQPKDQTFIAPFGSAFDDNFINGKSFDFVYDRGHPPGGETDEPGELPHYFKQGDTIVVKFCTIDHDHFSFLRIFEQEVFSNGNPFAAPTTIPTNIKGGALGIWGGYGVTYDTLVAF